MARNAHTSRTGGSPADSHQYDLPWSPTQHTSTSPANTGARANAESPHTINVSPIPRCDENASPALVAAEPAPELQPSFPNRNRRMPSLSLRARVERLLRDRGIPYVNVDEAKRALFSSAKLRAFHFVAYRTDGPNWLIFAARADRQARENMAEWERVFGEGFVAVLASLATGEPTGIHFRSLDGQTLTFDVGVSANAMGYHTQGGGPC